MSVHRDRRPGDVGYVIWPDYTVAVPLDEFDYERDWSHKSDDYTIVWCSPDLTEEQILEIAYVKDLA